MRVAAAVLSLLLATVLAAGRSGASDALPVADRMDSVQVSFSPERPVQGHLFLVRVDGVGPGDEASGRVAGEELHFAPAEDGALESLAPVPVSAEGSVDVHVVVRSGGEDPAEVVNTSVAVTRGSYHHERLTVAPELGAPLKGAAAARLKRDQAKARAVARQAHETPRLWGRWAMLPREGRVTGGFGDGRIFNGQVSSRHMGLDLNGAEGDTVRAAARGVVALVDDFLLAGNIVYLVHGGGLLSGYFHLSRQLVEEGDTVEAGQPIGLVGATGRVTGPHLHWVVRYGTTSVDPRSLLEVAGR